LYYGWGATVVRRRATKGYIRNELDAAFRIRLVANIKGAYNLSIQATV